MAYEVTVKGEGVDMAKEVEEEKALAVLSILMGVRAPALASAGNRPAPGGHAGGAGSPPDLTIGEFVAESVVSTNPERIAAIAMYLRDYRGEPTVEQKDIPALFQQAGESPPKNPSRDMTKAVGKRLMAEDANKPGHFRVTRTGEKLVRGEGS